MTGSSVLLMGFADHGQDTTTQSITSKTSWVNAYGKPTNEAERYFYAASMEVLTQGGKLYSSKIPYDNVQSSCYVGQYYKINDEEITEIYATSISDIVTDKTISSVYAIDENGWKTYTNEEIDSYLNGSATITQNNFLIIDKNKTKLTNDSKKRQVIGILPVVTTPFNALYVQRMYDNNAISSIEKQFNAIGSITTKNGDKFDNDNDFNVNLYSEKLKSSLSKTAAQYFKTIGYDNDGTQYTRKYLNKIGIVVFQMYVDIYNSAKIGFSPVESFIGGFDKTEIDATTNSSTFIDKIINTNSEYIYFFSNVTNTKISDGIKAISLATHPIFGFTEEECEKTISLTVMNDAIDKIFEKNDNIIEKDIDIVCDAGITNIAQFVSNNGGSTEYTPETTSWTIEEGVDQWKTVRTKIDQFCKNTRKDCIFILDAPRPFVLECQQPKIRDTKPTNTIDNSILPYIGKITGYETSYTAGYSNWFKLNDDTTGNPFWCPPSIAAMGVYINCDLNANYWDAPAGLNRGKISVLDLSFNPSIAQAGELYQKGWNYAINWSDVGPTIEGQHTLQVQPTAFDRVNVRRLFLRLERQAFKIGRYFVYEGNTAYTRQRLIDTLEPIFNSVKTNDGIYDYKIVCDETNNTAEVIDNNELRIKIGIKPVKTAEFVLIDFYCLATGGSFEEDM